MQGIHFQENYIQRLPAGLSVEQIIRQLAQPLVAAELVVPDFADHVLKREATYPTGLPTEPPCVAIPHTDHKHVRHNAIAVGILPGIYQGHIAFVGFRLFVHQFEDPLRTGKGHHDGIDLVADLTDGHIKPPGQQQEGGKTA